VGARTLSIVIGISISAWLIERRSREAEALPWVQSRLPDRYQRRYVEPEALPWVSRSSRRETCPYRENPSPWASITITKNRTILILSAVHSSEFAAYEPCVFTAIGPERGLKRPKLVGEFTQTPQLSSGLASLQHCRQRDLRPRSLCHPKP
jgi:hypothetical protein